MNNKYIVIIKALLVLVYLGSLTLGMYAFYNFVHENIKFLEFILQELFSIFMLSFTIYYK